MTADGLPKKLYRTSGNANPAIGHLSEDFPAISKTSTVVTCVLGEGKST